MERLNGAIGQVSTWFAKGATQDRHSEAVAAAARLRELDEVEEARREWLLAQQYFDAVGEPELVDQAIHRILATERHYMYLLRKAREGAAVLQTDPRP